MEQPTSALEVLMQDRDFARIFGGGLSPSDTDATSGSSCFEPDEDSSLEPAAAGAASC